MGANKLKLLLVDFDGVMSNGRFYNTDDPDKQGIAKTAVTHIFTEGNAELLNGWMRGKYSYSYIHKLIESKTGIPADDLDALLTESVKRMPINQLMLTFLQRLRRTGVIISLFTNNMDIFDTVSRSHHKLDNHFDHIYSSSAYGQLKLENDTLVSKACLDAAASRENTAFVDDSTSSLKSATEYGILTFLYTDYIASQDAFENWLLSNFSLEI